MVGKLSSPFTPALRGSEHCTRYAGGELLSELLMDTLSDFPELVAEHEQLVELIRAGDKAAASALLDKHLDDAERLLVAAVAG